LDASCAGAPNLTIGDGLSEADGYGALLGQPVDAFAAVDRRLDLDRALGTLPQEALPLCAELIEQSPHELAKASPTSRATLCCVATPPIAPMFSACLVARSRI
jgi:hypothetical protein